MSNQFDFSEDTHRLPEGFKRIAYDSDSMRFIFRDHNGRLYQGEAEAEYGILTPISASTTSLSRSRPNALASDSSSTPSPRRSLHKQKLTFQDILPSNLITTASLSQQNYESPEKTGSPTAPRKQFVTAVRKSVLPKMQGVVYNIRYSVTPIRGKRPTPHLAHDEEREFERVETRGLVHSVSHASIGSDMHRSAIVATSRPHLKPLLL